MTRTDDYAYDLPAERIAQAPLTRRVDARLMVVDRRQGTLGHQHIRDLPELLRMGDAIVVNDTRVIPARLIGRRVRTGGRWQGLFLREGPQRVWRILARTRGHVAAGEEIVLLDRKAEEHSRLRVMEALGDGQWHVRPETELSTQALLEAVGRVPLPHYIRDGEMLPEDVVHYQTVFARTPGSVAAPTAGLHFTPDLFQALQDRGVIVVFVTLHVGLGTFRPIVEAQVEQHAMHAEFGQVTDEVARRLNEVRLQGGRIIAVGTTTLRVLETCWRPKGLAAWSGETDLFVGPGYRFRAVDALLTNFHLPRSTLLVLVRTFGGETLVKEAYAAAIHDGYRFYSYGDAMLIV